MLLFGQQREIEIIPQTLKIYAIIERQLVLYLAVLYPPIREAF